MNKHKGSKFDDFLREEEILILSETAALKRVLTLQFKKELKEQHVTKISLAKRMRTSRSSIDRLLDSENKAVTLQTLVKAANALNKKIHIEIQ